MRLTRLLGALLLGCLELPLASCTATPIQLPFDDAEASGAADAARQPPQADASSKRDGGHLSDYRPKLDLGAMGGPDAGLVPKGDAGRYDGVLSDGQPVAEIGPAPDSLSPISDAQLGD